MNEVGKTICVLQIAMACFKFKSSVDYRSAEWKFNRCRMQVDRHLRTQCEMFRVKSLDLVHAMRSDKRGRSSDENYE